MKGNKKTYRRYSPEEIKKHILSFQSSGMNRHRYARINKINYYTFNGWLEKYKGAKPGNLPIGFAEVTLPNHDSLFAELRTENGTCIRFYQVPPPEYLKLVLSL
jgi:hypothetical protein